MTSLVRQRISSLNTLMMKLLPLPPMAGVGVLILMSIVNKTLRLFPEGMMVLCFSLAALVFFSWYSSRLKFVSLEGDNLYVSGLLKAAAIPVSEVARVHYSKGLGLVFVRLKSPSAFGNSISFMPTLGAGVLAMFDSPSVVEELRDLALQASNGGSAIQSPANEA